MNTRNTMIVVLSFLLASACGDVPVPDTPPYTSPSTFHLEDPCDAAEDYIVACGASGQKFFAQTCTPALAHDLLELECGELPDALAESGMISADNSAGPAAATVAPSATSGWWGGWLACALGFKFACPIDACVPDAGFEAPDEGEECIAWAEEDSCTACEYYRCREAAHGCGEDGYFLGYVGRYCDKFSTVTQPTLSPAGQAWMSNVRDCLIQVIDSATGPDSTCEEIREIGTDSHAACYVEAGFCDLSHTDWFAIVHTIDPGDIPFQQTLSTGHLCLQDWFGP